MAAGGVNIQQRLSVVPRLNKVVARVGTNESHTSHPQGYTDEVCLNSIELLHSMHSMNQKTFYFEENAASPLKDGADRLSYLPIPDGASFLSFSWLKRI